MAFTARRLCATLMALGCISCSSSNPVAPTRTASARPSVTPSAVASRLPEPASATGGGGTGISSPGGTGGPQVPLNKLPKKDVFLPDPPQYIPPSAEALPGFAKAKYAYVPTLGKDTENRGKKLFHKACGPCHGDDGEGKNKTEQVKGFNLRRAYLYKYGSSERALYRTIKYGIPRTAMGTWEDQLSEDDLWALVAYNRSIIGPEVEPGTTTR